MCRLALMNRTAIILLGTAQLAALFADLEMSLGGHGNGLAALWSQSRRVKIHKGLHFTTAQAAAKAVAYAGQEADWVLFHTRRATSAGIADRHCHPFRARRLVLAHNGHDSHFARLGKAIGISDSECITRVWAKMPLPVTELATCCGVFMGFVEDAPLVVKGEHFSDLLAAWHRETGALLFASDLPAWLVNGPFDQVVEVETIQWFGRHLDQQMLDIRPYRPSQLPHFSRDWKPSRMAYGDDLDDLPEYEGALDGALAHEGWPRLFQQELYDEEEEWEEEEEEEKECWQIEEQDWRLQRQVE